MTIRVLFVCLGNICRSPTAHAIFQGLVDKAGLADRIEVDSAGTGSWHLGKAPDKRATGAARSRGYDLSPLRARQVSGEDFQRFDFVLAMDADNLSVLERLAPEDFQGHLGLFLEFSDQRDYREVPDPYFGGAENFELVLDLVEDAASGLLSHITDRLER